MVSQRKPTVTLSVESWPTKATVYALSATGKNLELDIGKVTKRRHRMGKTPLRKEIDVGPYFVAVSYDSSLFDHPENLPHSGTFADVFPSITSLGARLTVEEYEDFSAFGGITKAYRVSGVVEQTASIVSLALPVSEADRRRPKPYLYPAPATAASLSDHYRVDAKAMSHIIRQKLADLGLASLVGDDLVTDTIAVLRKTGKARIFTDREDLAIEIADRNFKLMVIGSGRSVRRR